MKTTLITLGFCLLAFVGCSDQKSETTTRGNLHVLIAESIAPPMVEEINSFLEQYAQNGAHISSEVASSDQVIRRMIQDTARFIVTTRPMTDAERKQLPVVKGFDLTELVVAYDAIAVVVQDKNPVTEITMGEVTKILSGEITRWDQLLHAGSMKGKIELLYQDSSDVASFVNARVLRGQPVRKEAQRTGSSLETLGMIARSPVALGLVGVTWIDSARAPVRALLVAETRQGADTTYQVPHEAIGKYFSPHPANVYRNYYPMKRGIYIYTFGPVASLAAGFNSFVATANGQRLLLNRKIVPATQNIRIKGYD
jgi:phosphate transport system substrate-binding protein